jgi:hypothetical protein
VVFSRFFLASITIADHPSQGFYLKVSEAGFKTQVAFPEIDIPSSYECLRRHDKNGQHIDVVIPPDLFHGHYISERGGRQPLGWSAAGKTASGPVGTILKEKRNRSLATGHIAG